MKDTVNPKDIIQDVVHNFSSRYRGYAQYHNIQVNMVFGKFLSQTEKLRELLLPCPRVVTTV